MTAYTLPTHIQGRTRIHTEASSVAVTKEYCCFCFYCVIADSREGKTIGLMMLYDGRESDANTKMQMREGSGLQKKCVGFPMRPLGLNSEAERTPLKKRASSTTLHAQSTAAGLGRDRDMRRNGPMGALLAPQPRARETTFGGQRTASQNKKMHIIHRHIITEEGWLFSRSSSGKHRHIIGTC